MYMRAFICYPIRCLYEIEDYRYSRGNEFVTIMNNVVKFGPLQRNWHEYVEIILVEYEIQASGSDRVIEMQDVWKTYQNGTHALKGVSVKIDRNEFVYLVGPSGAGKSTFMKLIYREEAPTKGQISVNGFNIGKLKQRKIPYVRRNIGVIFQDFRLLPSLTAYENVAFAMEVIEAPNRLIRKRVPEVLELVGLKSKADREPSQLSGGEQQRIAIARAIVNNPSVIIADEPTGNLDPETSWGIMQLLDEINFRGTTIIMATHNKDIVNSMRKRVIAIEDGNIVRDQVRGEYGYDF